MLFIADILRGFQKAERFAENSANALLLPNFPYLKYMEREFKDILTDFLKENGLSQSDFARKLGAKPDSVNDWERGKAKPDYDNLRAMVTAFEAPAEYFLGLIENYRFEFTAAVADCAIFWKNLLKHLINRYFYIKI